MSSRSFHASSLLLSDYFVVLLARFAAGGLTRSGRLRVNSFKEWSRRAAICPTDHPTRAAANSIARGIPSNHPQILATVDAFSGVREKAGLRCRGSLYEQPYRLASLPVPLASVIAASLAQRG